MTTTDSTAPITITVTITEHDAEMLRRWWATHSHRTLNDHIGTRLTQQVFDAVNAPTAAAARPTLDDTERVLRDLLADAVYDVARFQGAGSDLDIAEHHEEQIRIALEGIANTHR